MADKKKPKKWKLTVELPVRDDVSEKIAKEKVAIAVANAFSYETEVVKVKSEKKVIKK